ncbi:type VI secretion system Vgr family protein [Paraburkholderia flava]|uniref:type VI secretion system Vgr family protein n=1 Tax=Paraburkholderia flava TaxID=2547393 RepID=UPI00105C7B06|nr:type VI secretion system Vgr family protein [Paraburkholderia flava]
MREKREDSNRLRVVTLSGAALPTHAGEPVLLPVRLHGKEKLGHLYDYTLSLKTAHAPTLPVWEARERVVPERLTGTEVTVSIAFDGKGTFIAGVPGGAGLDRMGAGTREITGLVTRLSFTGEDDRHAYYTMRVRPWLWLATRNRENRLFQNQSAVAITETILGCARYPFRYELRLGAVGLHGRYPVRDYVRQLWESDFDFLTRLWREWGIYYFMDGATLVLCDSPGAHRPHGNMYDTLRYHAPDGARIDEEHIHRLKVSRSLTAGAVSLTDYDPTQSRARMTVTVDRHSDIAFSHAEHYGWGDYAQPLAGALGLSGAPNDHDAEARYLAGVRVDAQRGRSIRAKGIGNLRGLATGHTFHLTGHPQKRANAEYLVVSTTLDIRNNGDTSGTDAYRCETRFGVQPASTFFRNRLKRKPHAPAETAMVVGPAGQPMWVDGYARVKVQFVWDRLGNHDEHASCWIRVSSPWQGSGFGFVALPRIGQEVTVTYHEGDPDRPYVSDRQVNQFNPPPWELPRNQALTGWRSRGLNGSQANQVVVDDTPGRLQVQLTSDHAQSRLVLGYNTRIEGRAGRQQARGEGFELATMAWGVMRANRGMLLTTDAREGATALVKDIGESVARLTQAREQHAEMAQLARRHGAQENGINQDGATQAIGMQNEAIRGSQTGAPFPEISRPDLMLASAAGIGMTAAENVHVASQHDHAVTAGRDVSIVSGRSLLTSVRGAISLFASQLGIRLYAGKGKVEIQAQGDAMALAALRDLTVTSTDGKIVLNAAKEIWLGAGGSFIQITGNGIVNGTSGQILEKCAGWSKEAATSEHAALPDLPTGEMTGEWVTFVNHATGRPLAKYPYRLDAGDGRLTDGISEANGRTAQVFAPTSRAVAVTTTAGQHEPDTWHVPLRDVLDNAV